MNIISNTILSRPHYKGFIIQFNNCKGVDKFTIKDTAGKSYASADSLYSAVHAIDFMSSNSRV